MKRYFLVGLCVAALAMCAFLLLKPVDAAEWKSGIEWEEPKVIDPGSPEKAPSDAIVLFDGKDLSKWDGADKWEVKDGVASPVKGDITSKDSFGDCQIHLEFATPSVVKGSGQGRGNSGLFLMNRYEVQILDSFDNKTYFDGQCGSIYKQHPPLVNACRKPGEWQTYEIIFNAPKFKEGKLVKPGVVTVLQNGVVVQNNWEILGNTAWDAPPSYKPHGDKGPIRLQNHGDPVKFRNIWVRELRELTSKKPEPKEPAPKEKAE